jgi:hypothetical protein
MEMVLVAVVVVAVVVASVLLARRVQHPEDTASHTDTGRDGTGERFYSDTDRPAGPDAEDATGPSNRFPDRP